MNYKYVFFYFPPELTSLIVVVVVAAILTVAISAALVFYLEQQVLKGKNLTKNDLDIWKTIFFFLYREV